MLSRGTINSDNANKTFKNESDNKDNTFAIFVSTFEGFWGLNATKLVERVQRKGEKLLTSHLKGVV